MPRRKPKSTENHLICAWCQKVMADDAEGFTLGVKVRPEYHQLAKEQAGRIIDFHLISTGRDVPAVVVAEDSEAKKDGKDLMFPACTMACVKALEAVLHQEKGLIDPAIV